jgi:hypothetical protein
MKVYSGPCLADRKDWNLSVQLPRVLKPRVEIPAGSALPGAALGCLAKRGRSHLGWEVEARD